MRCRSATSAGHRQRSRDGSSASATRQANRCGRSRRDHSNATASISAISVTYRANGVHCCSLADRPRSCPTPRHSRCLRTDEPDDLTQCRRVPFVHIAAAVTRIPWCAWKPPSVTPSTSTPHRSPASAAKAAIVSSPVPGDRVTTRPRSLSGLLVRRARSAWLMPAVRRRSRIGLPMAPLYRAIQPSCHHASHASRSLQLTLGAGRTRPSVQVAGAQFPKAHSRSNSNLAITRPTMMDSTTSTTSRMSDTDST